MPSMIRPNRGFSLIEVLVAVLIVAVGVLGIAALQITTTAHTESSLQRGQASMLAREIIERMRINVDEVKAGNYDINSLPTLTTNCTGSGADCSPAQIRAHDLRLWSARVTSLMPSGNASIVTDTSVDPVEVVVTLSWSSRRTAGMLSDAPTANSQAFTFLLHGMGS